jgi:hypothetical protein
MRNEVVNEHELNEGDWVLVRHENPVKFESNWFGPYQVLEKMLLGTYRLADPRGKELASLVHGNRLINARIGDTETLKKLWASPAAKDQLRARNLSPEFFPSDVPENTDALERNLLEADDDALPDDVPPETARVEPAAAATSQQAPIRITIPLKYLRERAEQQAAVDQIVKYPSRTAETTADDPQAPLRKKRKHKRNH